MHMSYMYTVTDTLSLTHAHVNEHTCTWFLLSTEGICDLPRPDPLLYYHRSSDRYFNITCHLESVL